MQTEIQKAMRADVGKIHHMKELQQLEVMFYNSLDIPGLVEELNHYIDKNVNLENPLVLKDLQGIDSFVKSYFEKKIITTSELWIVRGFVIGKILEIQEKTPTIYKPLIDINKLPTKVREAARDYNLTLRETRALEYSVSDGMKNLTNASSNTVIRANNLLAENIKTRGSSRELRKALEEEFLFDEGEINRNWKRVSISEINNAFSQGYVAQLSQGEWVYGLSLPDRCEHCGALIDGKFYPVITVKNEELRYDNLNPDSAEYKRRAWIAKNAVWLNKDNIGRSGAKRKRLNAEEGNKKENLLERHDHEKYIPVIPLHPYCFKGNSQVTMFDGTQKEIKNIKIGDKVISGKGKSQKVIGTSKNKYRGQFNTIITKSGKSIESTGNHKIFIKRKKYFYWVEASEIIPGDYLVELKPKFTPSIEEIKKEYINNQKSVLQLSKKYKVSRPTISNWLKLAGCKLRNGRAANLIRLQNKSERIKVIKKAHARMFKMVAKGEWGRWKKGVPSWNNGLTKETNKSLRKISKSKIGEKNPMYGKFMELSPNFTTGIKSYRKYFLRSISDAKKKCNRCPSKKNLQVHHKDRNRNNNNIKNLELLCASCHQKEHFNNDKKERNGKGQFLPQR